MKACGYCGCLNAKRAPRCRGCGQYFPGFTEVPESNQAADARGILFKYGPSLLHKFKNSPGLIWLVLFVPFIGYGLLSRPMDSLIWYSLTFGIPLLGLGICIVAALRLYRWASLHRISRMAGAAIYFFATLLPLAVARAAIWLGEFLSSRCHLFVFSGEQVWSLAIFMGYYCVIAVCFNLLMWFTLYCEVDEKRC